MKKEEKGTWQLSVFSRNWMINKTGLNLQYKAAEGFFEFVRFFILLTLGHMQSPF